MIYYLEDSKTQWVFEGRASRSEAQPLRVDGAFWKVEVQA